MSERRGWGGSALAVALACAVVPMAARPARAVIIRVINGDGPGEGLNDPTPATPVGGNSGTTVGEQRMIAFQRAADIWSEQLQSPVEIRIAARFDPLQCNATSVTLGMAGTTSVFRDFAGAPLPNTLYSSALADRLAGMDLAPGEADIEAQFNSVFGEPACTFPAGWYYGLDGAPSGDDSDMVTVVLHELGHGMGFLTFIDVTTGERMDGRNDAFMQFLVDDRSGKAFTQMSDAERLSATTATGDLKWDGNQVVAASTRLTTGADASGRRDVCAARRRSGPRSLERRAVPQRAVEPYFTQPIHASASLATRWLHRGNAPGSVSCPGDCDGDGHVTIAELIEAVRIALGEDPVSCVRRRTQVRTCWSR
jgi:hypothetical protein